ncbi:BZ3501_MvSof-1269-A2-R1_Chr11g03061 [Microbotryum saponariae]|nr:BZ3501_MvSof-1269-A2-R1_Chr11g03061 [Microbotryum saponariae]
MTCWLLWAHTLRSAQDLGARSEPGADLGARTWDLGARSEPGPLAQPQARWLWTWGARVSYLLDSGASHHMVKDASLFDAWHTRSHVAVDGAGGSLMAQGTGSITIRTSKQRTIKLCNIYYVPDLPANLISVMQLRRERVYTHFGKTIELRSQGQLIGVASLIANQLSTLDATPIRSTVSPGSICEESTLRSAQDLGARSEPGADLGARSEPGAPAQDLGARSEPGPLAQPQARWLWTRGARVSYSPPLEVFSLEPSHSSRTRPSHHHIMDSSPASPLAPRDPSSPESSIGEQIATLQAQLAVLNFAPSHF